MVPNEETWNSWSAFKKIEYVAHILATLALFLTVFFSWLTWKEANLARKEQYKFFFAQNAPIVEVEPLVLNNTLLLMLKNNGKVVAKDFIITGIKHNINVNRSEGEVLFDIDSTVAVSDDPVNPESTSLISAKTVVPAGGQILVPVYKNDSLTCVGLIDQKRINLSEKSLKTSCEEGPNLKYFSLMIMVLYSDGISSTIYSDVKPAYIQFKVNSNK